MHGWRCFLPFFSTADLPFLTELSRFAINLSTKFFTNSFSLNSFGLVVASFDFFCSMKSPRKSWQYDGTCSPPSRE